jgi:hypothetical protein
MADAAVATALASTAAASEVLGIGGVFTVQELVSKAATNKLRRIEIPPQTKGATG